MMQFRNIIGIAGGAVFLSAAAFAGISVKTVSPVSVPVEQDCPLSGEVNAGYASNYTCRGIVASHSLTEGDGIIPASVDLNYKLDDCNSVVGAASYTFLISGHHMAGEREKPGRFTEEPVHDAWLEPDSRRPAWEFCQV